MTRWTWHGVTLLLTAVALLATATGASAAAPTAITGPVTAVGATTATATGTVNPGGVATSWNVEYGTTTAYGSKLGLGERRLRDRQRRGVRHRSPASRREPRTTTASSRPRRPGRAMAATASSRRSRRRAPSRARRRRSRSRPPRLSGSVDPNATATTWWFDYGTSTSYGSKTTAKSAGSGTGPTSVSEHITGLQTGRTYHFRLVAMSDGGTTLGADASFRTSGSPFAVDRRCLLDHADRGAPERLCDAERAGDHLALRLRHDHVVRLEDGDQERRLGHERPERGGGDLRPEGVHDLPLPDRRLELRWHDVRQRPDVLDLACTRKS